MNTGGLLRVIVGGRRSGQEVVSRCYAGENTRMSRRQIYDSEKHAQFITFSCYRRRRMLDCEPLRDTFLEILKQKLSDYNGICSGYTVMPDHVHMIVWFEKEGELSRFIKSLKQTASQKLKRALRGLAPEYAKNIPLDDPFWQAKYYPFNLYNERKAIEKLDYMHKNPVTAGLVERAVEWKWSSARFYLLHEPSYFPLEWIFS